MIPLRINNKTYQVPEKTSILEACNSVGVYIPTLCYHADSTAQGKCGLCLVKVDGTAYSYACMMYVKENMTIDTESEDVIAKVQKAFDEFIDMATLPRSPDIEEVQKYLYQKTPTRIRNSEKTNAISFDSSNCINCQRCAGICADVMDIDALDDPNLSLKVGPCISCGQCTYVCPTNGMTETSSKSFVLRALAQGKTLVLMVDSSVCVSIGDAFSDSYGNDVTGKVISAGRALGFKYVFNSAFGSDLVSIAQADELLAAETRPLFSSSCPAWINYVEKNRPDLNKNLSTLKSAKIALARFFKEKYIRKLKIKPESLYLVALTSCIGAKDEIRRMQNSGDIDVALTPREFISMINEFELDWPTLKNSDFDGPFSQSSGSSYLSSISGGFTESVLRAIQYKLKQPITEFQELREKAETIVKTIKIGSKSFDVAVCPSIKAATDFISSEEYLNCDFIEVTACPGGCIYGGGQIKMKSRKLASKRYDSIIEIDIKLNHSSPYENTGIQGDVDILYAEGELIKTHYEPQESATLAMKKRSRFLPIVAYGSTTGKSTQYARLIASFVNTSSFSMNHIDSISMLKKRKVAIFVMSTGMGHGWPRNSVTFKKMLENSKDDLSDVKFAVFALGQQKYGEENFAVAGKQLFKLMEEHHAQPILPLAVCDSTQPNHANSVYVKFSHELASALYLKKPKVGAELINQLQVCDDKSILEKPPRPIGFEMATMIESSYLSPEGVIPAMHRYVLKLPDGMTYETGDHVTILPTNDEDIVDRVIAALQYDPNIVFQITSSADSSEENIIPKKLSVKLLLTQYLDLNTFPTRGLIRAFDQFANAEGKEVFSPLIDETNGSSYSTFIKDINVAEFICEYVQYGIPPLDVFVSACPHIIPRVFSIASAPDMNRGFLELMVLDVHFGPDNKRYGLTTHYLQRKGLEHVPIHCMRGIFKYPAENDTPIIMAALGTGISPMFSLIQHRMASKEKLGPAILIFGSRFRGAYPLLNKKLDNFLATGVVQTLLVVYSRDGGKHRHIQDLMREKENQAKMWELWSDPRTQFYYCGPKREIPTQLKEIMLETTMNEGWLSREEAMAYNSRHEWHIEGY